MRREPGKSLDYFTQFDIVLEKYICALVSNSFGVLFQSTGSVLPHLSRHIN